MTDYAELRRLAEQAIRSKDRGGPTVEQERFEKAANPAAVLSLLDELDAATRSAEINWQEKKAAEQRVAALEELAERYHSQHSETGTACRCHLCKELRTLQVSAQDASEGSD